MPYRNVPIKKDVDGKPIPQYFNEVQGEYEPATGIDDGIQKVLLCDEDGNALTYNMRDLFDEVLQRLDDLIEVTNNGT